MRRLVVLLLTATLFVFAPASPAQADGSEAPGAPDAFRSLTGGSDHTCALRYDGAVRCWGDNEWGQLGLGDTEDRGDEPGEMGDALPTVDLGTGRTATSISAGSAHTCALLDDGTVKCWGYGVSGRLGIPGTRGDEPGEMGDALPAVDLGTGRTATAVIAGYAQTCALLDNGTMKCWGTNTHGLLGIGDTEHRGDEPGEMGNALPPVDLGAGRSATTVTSGGSHTCALLDDGSVKCWGWDGLGQLGLGTNANSRGDGPGEMGDALPAVDLGTGRAAVAITAGMWHSCALLDDGTVKCWGYNETGELGVGDTVPRGDGPAEMGDALPVVDLGAGHTATAVSAGWGLSCALLDTGAVRCWGENERGQLGLGNTTDRGDGPGELGDALPTLLLGTDRTASALSLGFFHVCALLDNDQVKCWGDNGSGRLGLGDTGDRGDDPGEVGDVLPAVDLPPPNDDFADAQVLTGPAGTARGSNANAFWEPDEPLHDGITNSDTTVWYRWTAPAAAPVRFDTTGSTFDTILAVYTGTALNALTPVASNDDTSSSAQSAVELTATAGTTYQVAVSGFGATGSGRVQLNWAQPPANDAFATPVTLTGPNGTRAGTNLAASLEPNEPDHNPTSNGAVGSIWYQWTAPAGGRTSFDTTGTSFDTVLAVYTGTALDALTPIAANDDIAPSVHSQVVFTATLGTTYRIALASFDGAPPPSGPTTLNWRQSLPCDGRAVTRDVSMGDPAAGTPGADVIRGTGGNDTINGLGGADRICGGNGTDTLTGGTGTAADRLFGEIGTDTLRGGAGNDALFGGAHNDSLFGEAGADTLNGGPQRDTCNGGPQTDTATTCEVRSAIP